MTGVISEEGVWNGILESIKRKLNGETIATWFNEIEFRGIDRTGFVVRLCAPNQVVRDWVNRNYSELLEESLSEVSLDGYAVDWEVARETLRGGPEQKSPGNNRAPDLFSALE